MSNLAIRGHATRGKEVIEILMMLGGKNSLRHWGILTNRLYNINIYGDIEDIDLRDSSKYYLYTIEEFLEKYPYKVGDKVIIEKYKQIFEILSIRWCTERNIIMYQTSDGWYPVNKLKPYKKETFGECIEKNIDICLFGEQETMKEKIIIDIPKGYEFDSIDDNNQQIILNKIEIQYPTTYEECCEVLGLGYKENKVNVIIYNIEHGEAELYRKFIELKRCRDAYWKLYGKQIGLKEPWKPIHQSLVDNDFYTICCFNNEVSKGATSHRHSFLEFPTEEIRDMFFNNFKDIIEFCKELI